MISFKRFDLIAIIIIFVLTVVISILLILGDTQLPQVIKFSWANQQIGFNDHSFTLKFNRLMNQESVNNNIDIEPKLDGKISWSGKELTYTLTDSLTYGKKYILRLNSAQELDRSNYAKKIKPFEAEFQSRDLIFGYIGLQDINPNTGVKELDQSKQQKGKLILYNQTLNESKILTPPDLWVVNFAIKPQGDRAIISAFNPNEGFNQQKLFTVTTGLKFNNSNQVNIGGKIRLLLDSKNYENIRFKLSKNGETLIVERKNRQDQNDHSLWIIAEDQKPQPLGILGQNFDISPDGNTLIITLAEGISFYPLNDKGQQGFITGGTQFFGFSSDNSQKLIEKININGTYSLFLVNQDGKERELGFSFSPFINCQFQPTKENIIYCAKSDPVEENGVYVDNKVLARIDLNQGELVPLIALPNDPNLTISFASDGSALIFDQVQNALDNFNINGINEKGQGITNGKLWILSLPEDKAQPNPKNSKLVGSFIGYHPKWLP